MTIQQLGNLGEFLAAIATLATLIYLALQIRRNTAIARATGTSEHTAALNQLNYVLSQNPELCNLYFDGLADPGAISEPDVARFDMMIGSYLACLMQTYHLFTEGALGKGIWTHQLQQLKWLIRHPGFKDHWFRWERPSDVPFNTLVAELLEQEGPSVDTYLTEKPMTASPSAKSGVR